MGSAIAASLAGEGVSLTCTAKSDATLKRIRETVPGAETISDNRNAVAGADMVILAVKPYIAGGVIEEINPAIRQGAIIVSVIAGISIADLRGLLRADERKLQVFRVIPNTAIRLGESVTFIACDDNCSRESLSEVEHIFGLSGTAITVPEKDMAACTSVASCGIAFFLRFIRAMAEGGVELGLPAGFATKIAALTAAGAAALLKDGAHPEAEIDKVTTPGGITIKGLNAMEANGFTSAVIEGLKATCPGR